MIGLGMMSVLAFRLFKFFIVFKFSKFLVLVNCLFLLFKFIIFLNLFLWGICLFCEVLRELFIEKDVFSELFVVMLILKGEKIRGVNEINRN